MLHNRGGFPNCLQLKKIYFEGHSRLQSEEESPEQLFKLILMNESGHEFQLKLHN